MASDTLDLTGQWHGTYGYPKGWGPATPFIATIADSGGQFSGSIIEPDTMYGGDTLTASIAGHRSGTSVDFTKNYRGARIGYENPVDYVGRSSADGTAITGVWSLLDLDGTFEMFREQAVEEPEAAEVTESAPEPAEQP